MPDRTLPGRASRGLRVQSGLLSFCTVQASTSRFISFVTGSTGSAASLPSALAASSASACALAVASASGSCRPRAGAPQPRPPARGARAAQRPPEAARLCSCQDAAQQRTPAQRARQLGGCASGGRAQWPRRDASPAPGARLLVLGLGRPELDGKLDEFAVLLDQRAQLGRIGQLGRVRLQVQRDARAARQVAAVVLAHLRRARARSAARPGRGARALSGARAPRPHAVLRAVYTSSACSAARRELPLTRQRAALPARGRARGAPGRHLELVAAGGRLPAPLLRLGRVLGLHGHAVRDQERGIKAHAELADQVGVALALLDRLRAARPAPR